MTHLDPGLHHDIRPGIAPVNDQIPSNNPSASPSVTASALITHLLEARARTLPEPSALHLTRRADLLDLELPEPDLSLYDPSGETPDGTQKD